MSGARSPKLGIARTGRVSLLTFCEDTRLSCPRSEVGKGLPLQNIGRLSVHFHKTLEVACPAKNSKVECFFFIG